MALRRLRDWFVLPPQLEHAVSPSQSLYLDKLERRAPFSAAARQAFLETPTRERTFDTYRDIVREGEPTTHSCFVKRGLVSRYKTLRNGARSIVSFHIAGDMVDLQSSLVLIADHGIRTHVPTTIVEYRHEDILRLAAAHAEIGRAFWFDCLVDASIFREWTLNVGRRTARERIAHLLLEMAWRMKAAGLIDGTAMTFPISQADLADAVGISAVHVNRSLQALRAEGLIRTYGKTIVIERWEEMAEMSDFTPVYLHPEGPRQAA